MLCAKVRGTGVQLPSPPPFFIVPAFTELILPLVRAAIVEVAPAAFFHMALSGDTIYSIERRTGPVRVEDPFLGQKIQPGLGELILPVREKGLRSALFT